MIDKLNKLIHKYGGFDFRHADIHKLTNDYHPYPATMIPQLPDMFLEALDLNKNNLVLDPFVGSGTTLVECLEHQVKGYGTDMNPLAILISNVKVTYLDQAKLNSIFNQIKTDDKKLNQKLVNHDLNLQVPHFKNINYWFKPYVIQDLQIIKNNITKYTNNKKYRDFFKVVFSKTIRYVSNTRNGEFKMYRINKNKLGSFHPNVFKAFNKFCKHNILKNKTISKYKTNERAIFGNAQHLPFKANTFDSLITSPPYGDSKTTVAYGQFSRLSLQWLNLDSKDRNIKSDKLAMHVDNYLLGGHRTLNKFLHSRSKTLNHYIQLIKADKPKRAMQVLQFYSDLDKTLADIARVMKPNSYQFWVTGNRRVDNYRLPTNTIITELFKKYGVVPVKTYNRDISGKRMPGKNSPTNDKGKKSSTMNKEQITIYQTRK